MADSDSKVLQENGNGENETSTGEKHQIQHESPDAKRPKTENQKTLEDVGVTPQHPDDKPEEQTEEKTEEKAKPSEKEVEAEGAVQPAEEPNVPSNILEKGIIYFFMRGRVNIQDPESVQDIARSHILLRPIANDARLGEGTLADVGNTRLLALPKKTLPVSGRDRFMVFVENSGASYDEIKKEFLAGSEYDTKTAGTRRTPAATPIGEGVYAITSTGQDSHLAYLLTLPEKLDEVQKELGLKKEGSFILSTKNPQHSGPANTQLPEGPDFPEEIIDEFRTLRWMPSKPAHLDYVNAQLLLIGESSGIKKAVEPQKEDEEKGKEDPKTVLENLEEDDFERMKDLAEDESTAIFADLHAQAKDYPKLQTTF
ncbi:hypothetical protein CDV36_000547 [Fusarium kuroshium]|uniref:Uncharacterized protein n=1 Tax=Fusarium kuroshium TaxID=2010991 RepID=A0A3M2SQD1_9HYPO|nr:hypothetical protein CDV36_000547 [Fusarium kuroshium]